MFKKITELELLEINRKYDYNKSLGTLYWGIDSVYTPKNKGDIAGYTHYSGYRYIMVNKWRVIAEHRIIWVLEWGLENQPDMLDHIDSNRSNNKIENLREANNSTNAFNSRVPINNKLGEKGVFFARDRGKYRVSITINGKKTNLGQFDTFEEAKNVSRKARKELHGEFYNPGKNKTRYKRANKKCQLVERQMITGVCNKCRHLNKMKINVLGGGKIVANCNKCGHKVYFKSKAQVVNPPVEEKQPEMRNDD